MDFVQKSNSLLSLFLQKLCQKTPFLDVLNRKQSFLDQKIEILTRTKKWTFFKGVSPWILFKNRTFSFLLFSQKFYQKTAFLILWKEKKSKSFSSRRFLQKSYQKRSFLILWKEKNDVK